MSIFQKNLHALEKHHKQLATKLQQIDTNSKFDIYVDENDPINVNIYDNERDYIFYKTKPIDEVTQQYRAIMDKKSRYPLLFFYGMGNGLLIKMFTNIDKWVIVFEPEIELIYVACNLFDYSNELEAGRLHIFYQDDINYSRFGAHLRNKDIKTFLKLYDMEITHNYYEAFYQEDMVSANKSIVKQIKNVIDTEGNDSHDSLIGLNHHLQHLSEMISSSTLQSLVNGVNTQNAVIVSTGPSLAKQLPLLKKYAPYITILCIDASLPILQKEGIAPDIVFSLERVEATAKFYENLDRELLKDTIFAPTSIVHPKLLKNIKGMKKVITMRPFGYTFAFRLKKWGYIGVGMSAANMAMDFAYLAKFKNIVLIGQDLAFAPDGKTHSKGAIYGENETQYERNTLYVKGYYGDDVKTSQVWNMFLNHFQQSIDEMKETHPEIKVINATEGGAYIEGAKHISFKEFLESIEMEKKESIVCSGVSDEKQQHYIKRSKRLVGCYIERLGFIKERVDSTFLKIMEQIEFIDKLDLETEYEKVDYDHILAIIDEIDRIKDIYEEDRALAKFGNITNPYILNAELELACIMVRESNEDKEKKLKLIDWIYAHKSWLFFLSAALENILFLLEENRELKPKELS